MDGVAGLGPGQTGKYQYLGLRGAGAVISSLQEIPIKSC